MDKTPIGTSDLAALCHMEELAQLENIVRSKTSRILINNVSKPKIPIQITSIDLRIQLLLNFFRSYTKSKRNEYWFQKANIQD